MINLWFQIVFVFIALSSTQARPKEDVNHMYRSIESTKDEPDESFGSGFLSGTPAIGKAAKTLEDIAVVARSSQGNPALTPTSATTLTPKPTNAPESAPAITVAQQTDKVVEKVGQLVEKDARAPPKLKGSVKDDLIGGSLTTPLPKSTTSAPVTKSSASVDKIEANGKFAVSAPSPAISNAFEGKSTNSNKEDVKGIAVPVIMDEELEPPPKKLQKLPSVIKPGKDEKKKSSATTSRPVKETPTTTPSSGLSTWILLSDNREATTPTSTNKKKVTTTTKKPYRLQNTVSATTSKPAKKTSSQLEKKESSKETQSALETLVRQKAGSIATAQKKKTDEQKDKQSESKKVVTVPPAIMIETAEKVITPGPATTEITPETTTKKKKSSNKKRKKNKNRKKPAEKSGSDQIITDLVKQPKQPVGAQFYNFLSREIMPTVGLGLVGVLVTAGLAGLLGYNPFYGANIPVRRTYESQHGYYPNGNYYTYNSGYGGESDTGKNEEVLFREVLSGMPEDSRYGMPPAEVSYPEAQLYSSQEQAYNAAKNPSKTQSKQPEPLPETYSDQYETQYDSYNTKEQVGSKKYPVYGGGSFSYPEKSTEKFKASAKYSEDEPIEKQPEALYRVSSDYTSGSGDAVPDVTSDGASATDTDQSWHRIGSPMESIPSQLSHVEPGPRKLDLDKMTQRLTESNVHKRNKRSPEGILARLVRRSNEVNINLEDERDNEIDIGDGVHTSDTVTTTRKWTDSPPEESTSSESYSTTAAVKSTTDGNQPSLLESFPSELAPETTQSAPATTEAAPSLMDVIKRLAQFKLRLGISFLKATTDAFGRYLEGVQQRVEDSMANATLPAVRYTWLGRQASSLDGAGGPKIREKRYQRAAKQSRTES